MNDGKQLYLIGVNYRTASAEAREQLAFSGADAVRLLRAIKSRSSDMEALVLSTCVRSEFYLAAPEGVNALGIFQAALEAERPEAALFSESCSQYIKREEMAAAHLFTVATGLDSVILGDQQILAQLKDAMNWAREAGSLGGVLHETVRRALSLGKRARRETGISHGAATLGAALLRIVHNQLHDTVNARVMILGAGCIARDIARQFSKHGMRNIRIFNRTLEKAEALARAVEGLALPWDWIPGQLEDTDILIAATAADAPVIPTGWLEKEALRRERAGERPLLLVDAGMPRNIAAGPGERINVESIREQREKVLSIRQAAIPDVRATIRGEVDAWNQWRASQPVEQELKLLFQEWARIHPHSNEPGRAGNRVAALLHRHAVRLRRLGKSLKYGPTV